MIRCQWSRLSFVHISSQIHYYLRFPFDLFNATYKQHNRNALYQISTTRKKAILTVSEQGLRNRLGTETHATIVHCNLLVSEFKVSVSVNKP